MMAVREKTGGNVVLNTSEDRSLMGGVVIQVRDEVLDGSVRSRLASVRSQLLETPTSDSIWDGDVEDAVGEVKQKLDTLLEKQDWAAAAIQDAVDEAIESLTAVDEDGEDGGDAADGEA